MDLNKVCLIGNLGKDPEVKAFDNGGKIANFSIATTRKWTSNGEKNEKTEWHNITIRDKNLVEVADKYLQKGTRVYLEGRLETRKYTKDGADRYITEIVLSPFESRLQRRQ
jgi:single-strand DNA-binding protein